MRYFAAAFATLFAALLSCTATAAPVTLTPSQASAAEVTRRIEARDCAGAVEALKSGLRQNHADVALLAATMYENGVCVRRDWDRAVLFYAQAYQAGMQQAADRMAAGFAAPENGADVAAALWWIGRGSMRAQGGQVLAPCAVSQGASGDIDRFVAELKTWPPSRLAMCNYVAGVMASLAAEIKYPERARRHGLGGEVMLRFLPAVPKIELKKSGATEYQLMGVVPGDWLRERDLPKAGDSFESEIGAVAERTLRRYPQPSGIPAEAAFAVRWVFELE